MNIVTGYTGTPHITANEAQALNQGIFGGNNYVLNVGSKFSATLVDANTITIEDGEGMIQGVQFRIAPGDTEDVTIENGTTGYKRIDLICARYTKDAQTGVEAVNLVVVEGTPSASTPSTPTINTGDVLLGGSPVDFPLYEVDLDGLTPTIKGLFDDTTSSIILPPDFALFTRILGSASGSHVLDQEITTDADGWYAVLSNKSTSGITFADAYIYIYVGDRWVDVAKVAIDNSDLSLDIMTPWLFFRKGTRIKVGGSGTAIDVYYAPCMK